MRVGTADEDGLQHLVQRVTPTGADIERGARPFVDLFVRVRRLATMDGAGSRAVTVKAPCAPAPLAWITRSGMRSRLTWAIANRAARGGRHRAGFLFRCFVRHESSVYSEAGALR